LAIVTTLLLMPLGINRLGADQYGIWVLATQIPTLVVSPDLGLGQGLINEMGAHHRRWGTIATQQARLFGLVKLLSWIAFGWLALGTIAAAMYASNSQPTGATQVELFTALCLGLACFTSGIPATIWSRTQLAQERGHVAIVWEGAGKLASLAACIAILLLAPSVLGLVIAYVLPSTLALWGNAVTYVRSEFATSRPWSTPSLRVAYKQNKGTFQLGKYFVLMQFSYLFSTALDPYLINNYLGTEQVTTWTVLRRPFDLLPLAVSLYSTALWPVFARMQARTEYTRLRRIVVVLVGGSFALTLVLGCLLTAFRVPLFDFLGQGVVTPNLEDLLWLTLLTALSTAVLVMNNYLNAVEAIRAQAVIIVGGTAFVLGAKLAALSLGDLQDYFAASALSYLLFFAGPLVALTARKLSTQGREKSPEGSDPIQSAEKDPTE
jgi:O-antigen/teichoic acid export membrane protein